MQDSSLIRRHVSWRAVSRDAAVSFGCESLEAPVSNQHSHCFNLSLLTSSACRHRFEPHLWLRWMPAVLLSCQLHGTLCLLNLISNQIEQKKVNETCCYWLVIEEYQVFLVFGDQSQPRRGTTCLSVSMWLRAFEPIVRGLLLYFGVASLWTTGM